MTNTANTLEVRNLSVDFLMDHDEFRAVNRVNFHIKKGEIFGLAGESGCGKSTIAFAISRLLQPPAFISEGQVLVNGEDTLKMSADELTKLRWSKVSMVFQSAMNSLNPVLTVEEQFRDMFYQHKKYSSKESAKHAVELLKLVGISGDRLKDYPHQFSGGMRQRIVIAICLALKPDLLIMDEPTTALDVVVQREILMQIHELRKEYGFSVLFITHDLSLMTQLCDRIGVMYKGELVEVATAKEILNNPQHSYTQKLWGSIPSAFESGVITTEQHNTAEVSL